MTDIVYNGDTLETSAQTIMDLLEQQNIHADSKGIAVAHNGTVVPREKWQTTPISQGDVIDVVKPFQGG